MVRIITLRDTGKTWKEIGRIMEIDYRTCQGIYRRARVNGTPTNRNRQGRPPIFNAEEKEKLQEFVTRDKRTKRLFWKDVIQEMGYACSPRTLRNVMTSIGYLKRLCRKK
jgi:transposase